MQIFKWLNLQQKAINFLEILHPSKPPKITARIPTQIEIGQTHDVNIPIRHKGTNCAILQRTTLLLSYQKPDMQKINSSKFSNKAQNKMNCCSNGLTRWYVSFLINMLYRSKMIYLLLFIIFVIRLMLNMNSLNLGIQEIHLCK